MSLEQASFLAQILSAIAVFASLVFVGVQLRQANKVAKAAASQAHSSSYQALTTSLIEDATFASIWRRGLLNLDSLEEDEIVRFFAYSSAMFRVFEAARVQWHCGQLDHEHWHTIEQQAISLSGMPGFQAFWKVRGHWHCAAFRDWFDKLPQLDARPLYHQRPTATAKRRRPARQR